MFKYLSLLDSLPVGLMPLTGTGVRRELPVSSTDGSGESKPGESLSLPWRKARDCPCWLKWKDRMKPGQSWSQFMGWGRGAQVQDAPSVQLVWVSRTTLNNTTWDVGLFHYILWIFLSFPILPSSTQEESHLISRELFVNKGRNHTRLDPDLCKWKYDVVRIETWDSARLFSSAAEIQQVISRLYYKPRIMGKQIR